jgi:hypothetical protein
VQIRLQLIGLVLLGFELCQGLVFCALATEVPPNFNTFMCLFFILEKWQYYLPIENLSFKRKYKIGLYVKCIRGSSCCSCKCRSNRGVQPKFELLSIRYVVLLFVIIFPKNTFIKTNSFCVFANILIRREISFY